MDSSTAPDLTLSPTETSTSLTTPSFGQGMGCSIFMASIVPGYRGPYGVAGLDVDGDDGAGDACFDFHNKFLP